MLPQIEEELSENYEADIEPSRTWKLNSESHHMAGVVDGLESIKQTIFCILNTERYDHMIYSWNYGVELKNLFGEPVSYVLPELKRRITEALTQDERIPQVDNFTFNTSKRGVVCVSFTAHTDYGQIAQEWEVSV